MFNFTYFPVHVSENLTLSRILGTLKLLKTHIKRFEYVEDVWIPEHRLVPVGFAGSSHVFTGQSATDHRVIMMLHTPAAQSDVIKTCSISCLQHKQRGTLSMSKMFVSELVQFL